MKAVKRSVLQTWFHQQVSGSLSVRAVGTLLYLRRAAANLLCTLVLFFSKFGRLQRNSLIYKLVVSWEGNLLMLKTALPV